MSELEIKQNLFTLEITSQTQLKEQDLNYWWEKKYKEIFESNLEEKNELLINLNNAKENLDKVEFKEILNCLKSNSILNTKKLITKKDNFGREKIKNIREKYQYSIKSNSSLNKIKKKEIDSQNIEFPLLEYIMLLDTKKRKILELRYGLDGQEPLTLSEIGSLLGYTIDEVFEIKLEAIEEIEAIRRKWNFKKNFLSFNSKKLNKKETREKLETLKSNYNSAKKIKNLIVICGSSLSLISFIYFAWSFDSTARKLKREIDYDLPKIIQLEQDFKNQLQKTNISQPNFYPNSNSTWIPPN